MGSARSICPRHATHEYFSDFQSRYVKVTGQVLNCTLTLREHPVMGSIMIWTEEDRYIDPVYFTVSLFFYLCSIVFDMFEIDGFNYLYKLSRVPINWKIPIEARKRVLNCYCDTCTGVLDNLL